MLAAYLGWMKQSGPMPPLVVGSNELVGPLLLLGRQVGVERLECGEKPGVIVSAYPRKLLAQLEDAWGRYRSKRFI